MSSSRLSSSGQIWPEAWASSLVRSKADFDRLLETTMFRGKLRLLQAFVAGSTNSVTLACARMALCCGTARLPGTSAHAVRHSCLRRNDPFFGVTQDAVGHAAALAPLPYSGLCCVNYKLLRNGDISIFEINPRLGGSLMNPRNREFLRQAMAHIVHNAD